MDMHRRIDPLDGAQDLEVCLAAEIRMNPALETYLGGAALASLDNAIGEHVHIQYNPKRPSQCYYAPNNQLAARAVVFLVIAGCAAIVAVSIYMRHK